MFLLFALSLIAGGLALLSIPTFALVNAPLLRVKYRLHRCMEPGCWQPGDSCFYPDYEDIDRPDEYICWEHKEHSGFCMGCGMFWGGIESFEFLHPGWCDNCWHEIDDSWEYEYEDDYYDDWYFDPMFQSSPQ